MDLDPQIGLLHRAMIAGFDDLKRDVRQLAEQSREQGQQLATTEQTLRDLPCRQSEGRVCPRGGDEGPFPTKRQAAWFGGIAAAVYAAIAAAKEILALLKHAL